LNHKTSLSSKHVSGNIKFIKKSKETEREYAYTINKRNTKIYIGAALPSLVAALSHAATVAITDHPSSPALAGAIETNIAKNIPPTLRPLISVHAHEWGALPEQEQTSLASTDELSANIPDAAAAGLVANATKFAAENRGRYTRVICADCLWVKEQHENLVRSLLWFLAPPPGIELQQESDGPSGAAATANNPGIENQEGGGGVAWVVAGFHTGREVVASFFDTAEKMGLIVEDIWEMDLNATTEEGEVVREWMPVREGEGPENRGRWCVVAFLHRHKIH